MVFSLQCRINDTPNVVAVSRTLEKQKLCIAIIGVGMKCSVAGIPNHSTCILEVLIISYIFQERNVEN